MQKRLKYIIKGQVQGVGFRPFVYRLAHAHKLSGFVTNTSLGVTIEIEGSQNQLTAFNEEFSQTLPPLAKISSHSITKIPCINDTNKKSSDVSKELNIKDKIKEITRQDSEKDSFAIKHTEEGTHGGHSVLVIPDTATCKDCQNDILTKNNYRYAYPFTNCTNCGPRYTITRSIPYDRPYTSMACFPLCPTCKNEYENPHDRRFHAQPNACSQCGPNLWLVSAKAGTTHKQGKSNHALDSYADSNNLGSHTYSNTLKSCPDSNNLDVHINFDSLNPSVDYNNLDLHTDFNTKNIPHTIASPVNADLCNNTFDKNLNHEIILKCINLLRQSKIIAIKALGGFQLTCNAYDENAIKQLRIRKNRPHKAFAIMVADIETAKQIAHITDAAQELLCSPAAPIVLCLKKDINLPKSIAPDTNRIGIMLAYTPLHKMLFHSEFISPEFIPSEFSIKSENSFFPKALIMTSANAGGDPICIKNRQAIESLKDITDYYLFHNRDIVVRIDDSVCLALTNNTLIEQQKIETCQSDEKQLQVNQPPINQTQANQVQVNQTQASLPAILFFRRARGYVPSPISLPDSIFNRSIENISAENNGQNLESKFISATLSTKLANPIDNSIFATGAFLKNTFCLTRGNEAFVSQHIGDLDNLAVTEFYEETFLHLQKLLEIKPKAIVCDLHPDFSSTHFAEKMATEYNIPLMRIAHHYAHAYAVLAEYKEYELSPTLALILDGTGLGTDNTSWGGELLYLAPKTGIMLRLGRLQPMILPGGEIAIKEPWRIAQAMYEVCLQKEYINPELLSQYPFPWLQDENFVKLSPLLSAMIQKNIQCIESSGCGRLFDAISALLGLCNVTTYEGQAAIKLEAAQFMRPVQSTSISQAEQTMEFSMQNKYSNSQSIDTRKTLSFDCPIHENINVRNIKIARINDVNNISQNNEPENNRPEHSTSQADNNIEDAKPIWNLDTYALFAHFIQELANKKPINELAQDFHQMLSHSLCKMAEKGMQLTGVNNIVLSGGVMNNETLFTTMHDALSKQGFNVLTPQNMPSGDGAISLGQAFYGVLELQRLDD